MYSLSNSSWRSGNADMIDDMTNKIIVSCWHFFVNLIFPATSEVQNYQNKTREKPVYSSKYLLTTYFKDF